MPTSTGRGKVTVDCTDLDGLRGIASLWIMFFHILVYTNPLIDMQGNTLMPLFFSLSGFTLAIGYQGKFLERSNIPHSVDSHSVDSHPHDHDHENALLNPVTNTPGQTRTSASISKYFYNRLIRILPVYYICMAFAIPLTYAGYGPFDPNNQSYLISSYITNIIPVNTWIFFLFGTPFDGPEWTISTLIFFWICFPWLIRYYEQKSDEELLVSIFRCFWLQLWMGVILFVVGLFLIPPVAFWLATAWPISRLPVFIAGLNAGLLCTRHAHSTQMPWFHNSGVFVPWEWFIFNCWTKSATTNEPIDFTKTAYWQSLSLLTYTIILGILNACGIYIGGNIWFQFLNVFAQLEVMVSFVRLKGKTNISTLLRHPILLWFGELSMALYMVHFPCIFYACWIYQGNTIDWPPSQDCSHDYADDDGKQNSCQNDYDSWKDARTPQYWFLPIVASVAIGLATLLYYLVEEPVRKYWK